MLLVGMIVINKLNKVSNIFKITHKYVLNLKTYVVFSFNANMQH